MSYTNGTATAAVQGTQDLGGCGFTSFAQAQVVFYFEVVGPANVPVPVIMTASGRASATAAAFAGAGIGYGNLAVTNNPVFSNIQAFSQAPVVGTPCPPTPPSLTCAQSFSGSFTSFFPSNTLEDVEVSVTGFTGATSIPSAFSASVDPTLQIDPRFANASNFSLITSPAIITTSEPGSAALTLLGIGLVFGMRKRIAQSLS